MFCPVEDPSADEGGGEGLRPIDGPNPSSRAAARPFSRWEKELARGECVLSTRFCMP